MILARHYVIRLAVTAHLIALAAPAIADDYEEHRNGETIVDAPTTRVETGNRRTRVKVQAPYTKVDVDTKRRHVRIRVPYYNGDIRW